MAVITGKDGSVAVDSTNVSQITSWSISIEADTLEFTNFDSAGWKENKGSLKSWSGSIGKETLQNQIIESLEDGIISENELDEINRLAGALELSEEEVDTLIRYEKLRLGKNRLK